MNKEIIYYNLLQELLKNNIIAHHQKGKCKRDPTPMQGTALFLLTIAVSITMLLNSLFYP